MWVIFSKIVKECLWSHGAVDDDHRYFHLITGKNACTLLGSVGLPPVVHLYIWRDGSEQEIEMGTVTVPKIRDLAGCF